MNQEYILTQVEELIENDELYNIMNKRLYYCKNLETSDEPFGPPDICYIVKESQNKSFLGLGTKKVMKQGCYHYVYGLDTSNIAFISAYISKYIGKNNAVNKDGNNLKVIQSIFCVFDYFLEKDLRILIKFPGGIKKVFYIDDQQAIEANTEDLRTVFISSLMRSWNLQYPNNNSVYLEEIGNNETFNYISESIAAYIRENPEIKFPNFKPKLQKLIECYFYFLKSTRRFNSTISFFSKLNTIDLYLIKYVIKTLNSLQLYEESLKYIATYLISNPTSSILSLEVEILSILKKYDEAVEIGKINCSLNPENAENWLTLSEVYLRKKLYDNCLKALNNINILKEFSKVEPVKPKGDESLFKEHQYPKNKVVTYHLKYSDILSVPTTVDLYFPANQFNLCENSEVIFDTIKKIMTCQFYTFDQNQKKVYFMLLEMIKEINFDAFIDIRRKLFYLNSQTSNVETDRSSTYRSEGYQNTSRFDLKININPHLEVVIDNLIEDLKMFSIVIAQDDAYFNNLFMKDDLLIAEVKFCIAIGILSERLRYYNTSLKFYTKALKFSFSKFVFIRKIKIFCKLRDFKNALICLASFLNFLPGEQFKYANKTPLWIDKIILKILSEYSVSELMSWIGDSSKSIQEFISKRIIQKYKSWIEAGHEIHLLK